METQAFDDVLKQRKSSKSTFPEVTVPEKRSRKEKNRERSKSAEKKQDEPAQKSAPANEQYVEKGKKERRSRNREKHETNPRKELFNPETSRYFEDMDNFNRAMGLYGTIELDDSFANKIKNTPANPVPIVPTHIPKPSPNDTLAYGILSDGTAKKVIYNNWKDICQSQAPFVQITTDITTQPLELYHSKTICGNKLFVDSTIHVFDGDIIFENVIGTIHNLYVSPMSSLTLDNCNLDLSTIRCDGQLTFRNCRLMIRATDRAFQVRSVIFDHCHIKVQSMSPTLTLFDCPGNDEYVHSHWTNWEILGDRILTLCQSSGGRAFFNFNVFTIICPTIVWEKNSGSSIFSCRIRSGTSITMSPNVKMLYTYTTPKPDGI